jgi:hypothetical protein
MEEVYLEVYDLSRGMATQMSEAIIGMRIDGRHTGLRVYGKEYYLGRYTSTSSRPVLIAERPLSSAVTPQKYFFKKNTSPHSTALHNTLQFTALQYTAKHSDALRNVAKLYCIARTAHHINEHAVNYLEEMERHPRRRRSHASCSRR